MSNDIIMVFAQGFTFVGKQSAIEANVLKDAVEVKTTFVMSQQGLEPIHIGSPIGDLSNISQFPYSKVNTGTRIYQDYVKLTTGIDIPSDGLSH